MGSNTVLLFILILQIIMLTVAPEKIVDRKFCANMVCEEENGINSKKYCCEDFNEGARYYKCCNPYRLIVGLSIGVPVFVLTIICCMVLCCCCTNYYKIRHRSQHHQRVIVHIREPDNDSPPPYTPNRLFGLPAYTVEDPFAPKFFKP